MFQTNLTKQQAKEICEMHINDVLDDYDEEKELFKKNNPSLFKAYIALHEYAYN